MPGAGEECCSLVGFSKCTELFLTASSLSEWHDAASGINLAGIREPGLL